jgi:excisionase family DNA binding protein
MPRKTITLAEAAATYAVSARTLRRWIDAGRITAYRVGPRMIRLDPDELDRQLFSEPLAT